MARHRKFNIEEAIDKIMLLFWNKGFNGVSTQEIIEELNISKSSLYGAFSDKRALFICCLQHYQQKIIESLQQQLTKDDSVTVAITNVLQSICDQALNDTAHKGCFIVNSSIELAPHDQEIAAIVASHRAAVEQLFQTALNKGIQNGEIKPKNESQYISSFLCNTINGIYVDSKYLYDEAKYREAIKTVLLLIK